MEFRFTNTSGDQQPGSSGRAGGCILTGFFLVWTGFSGFMTWMFFSSMGQGGNSPPTIVVLLPGSFLIFGLVGLGFGIRQIVAGKSRKDPGKVSITQGARATTSGRLFITAFLSVFGIFGTVFLVMMVRDLSGWEYFMLLLPLVFIAISVFGIRAVWSADSSSSTAITGKSARTTVRKEEPEQEEFYQRTGPVVLKPKSGPLGKFIGMSFFCLFWNGITGVFVWQVVAGFMEGNPEWFLTLFMIPFVLVGLVLVGAVVHAFLGLFLPRPVLTISTMDLALGDTAELTWTVPSASKITEFVISLEGCEEATYRRGTDTHTDRHTFYRQHLYRTAEPHEMAKGELEIAIPHDAVPTFKASNNKILWQVTVRGVIPKSPDIDYEYPIKLKPLPMVASE